jgi:5-formyltetrahydrofolate cyclo-ligase
MTAQAMKQQLRQRIITARDALPESERRAMSAAVRARLLDLPAYRAANTVLGYMHFGAELQSEPWVGRVLADGKTLVLPKVNAATRELDLYRVRDLARDLAPGAWNILEPLASCARFAEEEPLDFILLPGVAFTREGARLGYGGGFYDKLLMKLLAIRPGEQTALHSHSAKSPENGDISRWLAPAKSLVMAQQKPGPALVAGAYSMQVVENIPQEATDRKVEWLVTENETLHCAA